MRCLGEAATRQLKVNPRWTEPPRARTPKSEGRQRLRDIAVGLPRCRVREDWWGLRQRYQNSLLLTLSPSYTNVVFKCLFQAYCPCPNTNNRPAILTYTLGLFRKATLTRKLQTFLLAPTIFARMRSEVKKIDVRLVIFHERIFYN